ncbi:MAG: ATP-binding cassette domain-containing protein [Eggerthellaceae bacterium]
MPSLDTRPERRSGTFIQARGLSLETPLGVPFRDLDLSIPPGSYVAVTGDHGSGKTPLLLTLAGRMKPTSGTLFVGGYQIPREHRKVARNAGMALFAGLNDIEWNLDCRLIMKSELELWGKPHRNSDVDAYMESWELGHITDTKVKKLTQVDYDRFGIALAMVNDPDMLVVDDIERQLRAEDTHRIADELRALAHEKGKTVIVAVTEPASAGDSDFTIELEWSEEDGI